MAITNQLLISSNLSENDTKVLKRIFSHKDEDKELNAQDITLIDSILGIVLTGYAYLVPSRSLIALNAVNKAIHNSVQPILNREYTYKIPKKLKLKYASPSQVKVSDLPSIPPSCTHLTLLATPPKPFSSIHSSIKHLILECEQPANSFPPSLTHLHFGNKISLYTKQAPLPAPLTHLNYGRAIIFSMDLEKTVITHLTMPSDFKNEITSLPSSLESLIFPKECEYNKSMNAVLPKLHSLTHLVFGINFSCPISSLPSSLEHLSFMNNIEKLPELPLSLQYLNIGHIYGYPLDLPHSLTHLIIGDTYNYPLDSLPPSLKFLKAGSKAISKVRRVFFNQKMDNLPASLTHLEIWGDFNRPLKSLPPNLTHLTLGHAFSTPIVDLPASLLYFSFGDAFSCSFEALPPKLTHLNIGRKYFKPLPELPSTLTHLIVEPEGGFNTQLTKLPASLTHLQLSYVYDYPLPKVLPSLVELTLGVHFNHPLASLPDSLRFLHFGLKFNHPLPPLPQNLLKLTLGGYFNHPISELPPHLTHFSMGDNFQGPIGPLPRSITHLMLGPSFKYDVVAPYSLAYVCRREGNTSVVEATGKVEWHTNYWGKK